MFVKPKLQGSVFGVWDSGVCIWDLYWWIVFCIGGIYCGVEYIVGYSMVFVWNILGLVESVFLMKIWCF